MAAAPHHGVFQAQGDDMKPEKFEPWTEPDSPCKAAGIILLEVLDGRCTTRESKLRQHVFVKMRRHVNRAPAQGIAAPHKNELAVQNRKPKEKGARLDLVIRRGVAFVDPPPLDEEA